MHTAERVLEREIDGVGVRTVECTDITRVRFGRFGRDETVWDGSSNVGLKNSQQCVRRHRTNPYRPAAITQVKEATSDSPRQVRPTHKLQGTHPSGLLC